MQQKIKRGKKSCRYFLFFPNALVIMLGIFLVLSLSFLVVSLSYNNSAQNTISYISVQLDIAEGNEEVFPGEKIFVSAEVLVLRPQNETGKIDIVLEYALKDNQGKIINSITETKGEILRITDVQEILVPADAFPGVYSISLTAKYREHTASDVENIQVIENTEEKKKTYFWIFLGAAGIGIIVLIFLLLVEYLSVRRVEKQLRNILGKKSIKIHPKI